MWPDDETPEPAAWIRVDASLPEPHQPVLLDIGSKYPIRAMWVPKFTLVVALENDSDFGEYSEDKDQWFCPEGWYEWNEHEDCHWAVESGKPTAWCALPARAEKDAPG
jgi:hypothetical protein